LYQFATFAEGGSLLEEDNKDLEILGTVNIYRSKRAGMYSVQPMREDPAGFRVEYGPPTLIPQDELESRIAKIALENLDSYSTTNYDDSQVRRSSDEEYKRFVI
jgi:hypothetical protein